MIQNGSRVRVDGAPGYDTFGATVILALLKPNERVIVMDDDGEFHVIHPQYVQEVHD